jgi:hypothetical protein
MVENYRGMDAWKYGCMETAETTEAWMYGGKTTVEGFKG